MATRSWASIHADDQIITHLTQHPDLNTTAMVIAKALGYSYGRTYQSLTRLARTGAVVRTPGSGFVVWAASAEMLAASRHSTLLVGDWADHRPEAPDGR